MTEDSVFPEESDRRHRRVTKSTPHEPCRMCGGALVLLVRGRDRRLLCQGCHKNPDQCGCARKTA